MADRDVVAVRQPPAILRAVAVLMGLSLAWQVPANLEKILEGDWVAVVSASLGLVGSLSGLSICGPLALLHWETAVDRRSRTVTRRAWLIRRFRDDHYRFDDFRGIVLRNLLPGASPDGPNVLAVTLIGPGIRLDFDDPGPGLFSNGLRFYARASAYFQPAARLALAGWLAASTGLKLRDLTRRGRPPAPPRPRPTYGTWSTDSITPALEFPEVNRRRRWLVWFILIDGGLGFLLVAVAFPFTRQFDLAGYLVLLTTFGLILLGGAATLSYRTLIVIDFPGRQVRRTRKFLGSRSDESFPVDRFEEVLVRELKVPFRKTPQRTVELAEGRFQLVLYDAGGVPESRDRATSQSLGVRAEGLDRGGRCLASAETLAGLLGLPMRVID